MAISFPSSPTLNQTYTVGYKTWIWNGYAWDLQVANTVSVTAFTNAVNTYSYSAYAQANSANNLAQSAYNKANNSTIRVGTVGAGNVISNVINSVTGINFDSLTGFSVEDLGSGNVKVSLGSSFKTWKTDGQSDLVAVGEDTIKFGAANGITITTNTTSDPKSITFSAYPVYNLANTASANTVYLQGVDTTQNTNISAANNLAQGSFNKANSSNVLAQAAFDKANTASANTVYAQGINNTQNTNITAVNTYATSGYGQANSALTIANAAYANTLSLAGIASGGSGVYSYYFDGSTQGIRLPATSNLDFGSDDFTIEFWMKAGSSQQTYAMIADALDTNQYTGIGVGVNDGYPAGYLRFRAQSGYAVLKSTTLVVDNTWRHIACVKSGSNGYLFVNGTLEASTSGWSGVTLASLNDGQIGRSRYSTGQSSDNTYTGYLSNFRILKGTALYTSNFTVPAYTLEAITNTQLLTVNSSTVVDNSINAFTLVAKNVFPTSNTSVIPSITSNNSGGVIGTAWDTYARNQANAANNLAQSSYNTANLKFNTSGGTITGNVNINANLIVTGANVSLGNVGNVHIYGGNTGQLLTTDEFGNLSFIDLPTPNTVTYTANSLIQTNGVYVSGNLWSTQVFGDYASSNGAYVLTDGTGSAPAWYIDFDFIDVVKFNRVVMNINYSQNSGHTIYVQLYNNTTSTWDSIGTYTGLGSYYAFALEVIDEFDYLNAGRVQLRLYHSNQGSALHQTSIDYIALEQSYQGPQGPRGPTGATGATGATGNGVSSGGTTGQVLIKNSSTNYDTSWSNNLIDAWNQANAAYDNSNTKFSSSGGTVSGNVIITNDLSITGNLYILGNTVSINTSSFTVQDSMIVLGLGNYTTDILDIGFAGHYNAGTNAHTGIIRDSTTKEYYVFQGYTPELDATNNINIADPSFATANINASYFKGNLIATTAEIGGYDISNYSSAAYAQANAANNLAVGSYNTSNTNAGLITIIQGVDVGQNTRMSIIEGVDTTQNTNISNANNLAQGAFNQANSVNTYAYSAYAQANATNTYATSAYEQANAATNSASSAFNKANGVVQTGFTTISANSISITPASNTDTLTIAAGNNISISACTSTKTITINSTATGGGGSGSGTITFGSAPPTTGNTSGDRWIDSSDGTEYTYFSDGDSSQWVDFTTPGLSGATAISGGSANSLVYQVASGNTGFIPSGTQGYYLTSGVGGLPTWSALSVANTNITGLITSTQIANTTVTPGTYGGTTSIPVIVIDQQGRITSAANTSITPGGFSLTGTTGTGSVAGAGTLSFAGSNGVTAVVSSNTVTLSTPQNLQTTGNVQFFSLGVGTPGSATAGEIRATNNITAYYSDERLKTNIRPIDNALGKLSAISGVYYNANDVADSFGYTDKSEQVGVIAQQVQSILPHVVKPAPFDTAYDSNNNQYSISGENYLTVQYEKLIPLLIECIKEQQTQINDLRMSINTMQHKVEDK